MARELFAQNFGSHGDFDASSFSWPLQISSGGVMFLLFRVFVSLILVPFVIFACGTSSGERQQKKKKDGGGTNYAVWGAGFQDVGIDGGDGHHNHGDGGDGHLSHGNGGDGHHRHGDGGGCSGGCGGDGGNS